MRMNVFHCGLAILVAAGFLSGCATSEKIQAKQISDDSLTCEELIAESTKLDDAQARIDDNRGVTGTNVASALFWLPGLAYTYYDAGQADELIQERRSWLAELHSKKNCSAQG
ncbi:MAG: hypothetical protein R3C97_04800 [Geminicoccaceae bacterium]